VQAPTIARAPFCRTVGFRKNRARVLAAAAAAAPLPVDCGTIVCRRGVIAALWRLLWHDAVQVQRARKNATMAIDHGRWCHHTSSQMPRHDTKRINDSEQRHASTMRAGRGIQMEKTSIQCLHTRPSTQRCTLALYTMRTCKPSYWRLGVDPDAYACTPRHESLEQADEIWTYAYQNIQTEIA